MPELYRLTDKADNELSTVNYQLSIGNRISDIVRSLAKRIFGGEKITFDPELLTATADGYLSAVKKGYKKDLSEVDYDSPDFETLKKITENVFQFSASKDFHILTDMTNALKDGSGKLRSFDDFQAEVDKMNVKYNGNWLRTEYNQAVAASQCAARWTEQVSRAKSMPFLQYHAVMDSNTRAEHAALHGVIKRVDSDFWDKYYPPNGWGCRCEVIQLPGKNYKETPDLDIKFTKVDSMFQVNVGKKGVVFPKGHPYFMSQCMRCKGVSLKLYQKGNPQCEACLKALEKGQEYIINCKENKQRCKRDKFKIDNADMKEWVTREEKGVGTYSVSKDNDRLYINSECDKNELAANARAAKAILNAFPKTEIQIRPNILKDKLRNPEYWINGVLADRKGITNEKGVAAGFNKAIKQGSSIVVIDCDDNDDFRKNVNIERLGNKIQGRWEDFEEGIIKECYVIHNGKVAKITQFQVFKDEKKSRQTLLDLFIRIGL